MADNNKKPKHGIEILRLTQVEQREIHRIVQVTQNVDVVEAQLHRNGVTEWGGDFNAVFRLFIVICHRIYYLKIIS